MAIYAKNTGSTRPPAPAGTHIARCVQVLDIGSHQWNDSTETITQRKCLITWELPSELFVFDPAKGEEPFLVSREYTLSTSEKSNLRKDLESWRGRAFNDEEVKQFDVSVLLGVPCMLTIIHAISAKKQVYAKITGVNKLMKGMEVPKQITPSVEYSVDAGQNDTFKNLPEWLRKKIAACEEWKTYPTTASSPTPPEEAAPESPIEDEDVPF